MKDAIRQRVWTNSELNELAQDVQKAFDKVLETEVRTFTDIYAEPMKSMISGLKSEPIEIRAARVLNDASSETPVSPGHVHFTYLASKEQARINTIAGLTLGERYRFTLVVTYA